MSRKFYNCHTHCFTYDHVPEYFLSPFVPISWLLRRQWLRNWIRTVPFTGRFGLIGSLVKGVLSLFFGFNKVKLLRYLNFVLYGDRPSQEEVAQQARQYYPSSTGFVMLSMDMEYMGAGRPQKKLKEQLDELAALKQKTGWDKLIYPFIFCDPRRLQPMHKRETGIEQEFIGDAFLRYLEQHLRSGNFQGIKLYPALGYWPFDKRMKPVYDLACANGIPFMTHCTIGAVHLKYRMDAEERYHPFKRQTLPDQRPVRFQAFLTHPLNYECLLNRELLKQHWGDDAPDYRELKLCIGHWGSGEDWHAYLKNARTDTYYSGEAPADHPALLLDRWHIGKAEQYKNYTWFSVTCDLMRKYPNVYADISYTLNDAALLPLLKMILEADEKIRQRVLFGTDFYLVSKAISEREFSINVRAALGNELFEQIAITNACSYLSNTFNPVPLGW